MSYEYRLYLQVRIRYMVLKFAWEKGQASKQSAMISILERDAVRAMV